MHERMAALMTKMAEEQPSNRWNYWVWPETIKVARMFSDRFSEPPFTNCLHTVDGVLALFAKSTIEQKMLASRQTHRFQHLILSEVLYERLIQRDPKSSVFRTLAALDGMPHITVSSKFAKNHLAAYTYDDIDVHYLSYAAMRYHIELPYYF